MSGITKTSVVKLLETENWYARIDLRPPPPNCLHVAGAVLVGNPGIRVVLTPMFTIPEINPATLHLELLFVQKPGIWPQVVTWAGAKYSEVVSGDPYTKVEISWDATLIAEIVVEVTH